MIRPVVVHRAAPGRHAELLEAWQQLMTATATAATGAKPHRVDLVHAVGLAAVAEGGADAARRHVPLAVSLDHGDVTSLGSCADTTPALNAAAVIVAESPADLAALRAAGCAPDRTAALVGAELGGRVADLEEHLVSVARTGRPAPARESIGGGRVAVVVVTHNRRALLSRCLDGLSRQDYPAELIHLVVVDNASTDGTAELLAERSTQRLTVISESSHQMPAAARNRAVAAVDSDIVAFTDDDCRPTPGWLSALVGGFRTGIGIVQGRTIADPCSPLTPLSRTQWTPAEYGAYETANVAYRREALPPGPFDLDLAAEVAAVLGRRFGRYPFGEDTDLAWRVKRAGRASRFSATAVVHHHVWPADVPYLLRRAVVAAAFPVLVRRVPELREVMLWHRWFLSRRHAELLLAAAVLSRRQWALPAAAPYLWSTLRPLDRGRAARTRALPVLLARDLVEEAALAVGSVRARTPVL